MSVRLRENKLGRTSISPSYPINGTRTPRHCKWPGLTIFPDVTEPSNTRNTTWVVCGIFCAAALLTIRRSLWQRDSGFLREATTRSCRRRSGVQPSQTTKERWPVPGVKRDDMVIIHSYIIHWCLLTRPVSYCPQIIHKRHAFLPSKMDF